jgi:hypothetical protein
MDIQDSKSPETVAFIKKLAELAELVKKAFSIRTPVFKGEKYLTNIDLCKLLHISSRTLQDYRDNGKIGYIQISGKILYKESDILKLLEDNYIPKYDKNDFY